MADFEAWLVFLILVVNVVGELQRKRTLAASRGFLAAARLSCYIFLPVVLHVRVHNKYNTFGTMCSAVNIQTSVYIFTPEFQNFVSIFL